MRKFIAFFLIIVFLAHLNCAQAVLKSRYKGSLFFFAAKYIQGSVNIPLKKNGYLVIYDESLQFNYKDITLDMPYRKIIDIRHDKDLAKVLPKIPSINPGHYEEQDWGGPGFLESLLYYGIAILVAILVILLLKWSESYTYLTIAYDIDGESEWCTFKIKTDDFNKIYPILNKKTDLE